MVLTVKGLGKLSWMVIRSFVACADKSRLQLIQRTSWYTYERNVVPLNI